ncbi:MAG: phosphoglucosamine mutase [Acidobacteriota bacterium]|nr:phosphoglucosamine mutase [Acidobacteriota bacterium]
MAVRFGTDGIRGRVGEEITLDLAFRLGRAVAAVFPAPVFVGYDTRESSPPLAAAVIAGLAEGGATGVNLGYFTTPGVAVIASQRGGVGVVVSASHNPYYDNGLKVIGPGGGKLDHATEEAVEAALNAAAPAGREAFDAPAVDASAEAEYVSHLRELVPVDLSGLSLVIDCANGAASHVAHELFGATGARVAMIHDLPDGHNINVECGSTDVASLVAAVRDAGADLGLAFDGDADRLIAVDARGVVRDGDDLMVLFTLDRMERARTTGLVVTTMSNLGLHRALGACGVEVVETDVGDRNVLLALEERAWPFGGEQSGHLIFRDLSPTGDGLLTGLLLCDLVVRRGALFDLAESAWRRVPQALVNVARDRYDDDEVRAIFDEAVAEFGVDAADVRLLVRPSGTEPVVRVMVEALDAALVEAFTSRLRERQVAGPRGAARARE